MKKQFFILFALVLLISYSFSHATDTKRGVHVSSDKEIKVNQENSITGPNSNLDTNSSRIDKQKMEATPQGHGTTPTSESSAGEKIED